MKKALGFLALQALMFSSVYAQFDTPVRANVNMVKSRILLVETQDLVTRTLMDLESRPADEQRYKDGVANYNKLIQEVVDKHWKFSKKIEYMTAAKVAALVREGKGTRYAILHLDVQNSYVNPIDIGPVYGGEYDDSARMYSKSKGYGTLSIQLVGNDKKTEDVYTVALPVAYPSGGDMVFALEMMQNVFAKVIKTPDYEVKDFRVEIDKYNKTLKKRTLLISKDQLGPKATLAELKEDYYYPIEIVDYKTVENAVMSNDSNYAYVQVLPTKSSATLSGTVNVSLRDLVIDAKDGKVLGTAKPERMEHGKIADDITKKEAKNFIKER